MDRLTLSYEKLSLYSRESSSTQESETGSLNGQAVTKQIKHASANLIDKTAQYSLERTYKSNEEKSPPVFEIDFRQKQDRIPHSCHDLDDIEQDMRDECVGSFYVELIQTPCSDGYSFFYHFTKDERQITRTIRWLELSLLSREDESIIVDEFNKFLKGLEQYRIFWIFNVLKKIQDSTEEFYPITDQLIYETIWMYEYNNVKNMLSSGGISWLRKYLTRSSDLFLFLEDPECDQRVAACGVVNPLVLIEMLKQIVIEAERPLSPCIKILEDTVRRYDQISEVKIENPQIADIDNFRIALFIENNIKKIEFKVDHYFKKRQDLPRIVIVDKKRVVYVLSNRRNSVIKGEGAFKIVKSALKVNLNSTSAKVERVVHAKLIDETAKEAMFARNEYVKIQEFNSVPGFVQCYKFFCFAVNGSNIVSVRPHKSLESQIVKSSFIFEEYKGKLRRYDDIGQFISIAWQIISSVEKMHKKDMVSWDLKRDNLLVREEPAGTKVVMSDFGLAFKIAKLKNQKQYYGSPWFGSPELLYEKKCANSEVNSSYKMAEMWSLGVLLYKIFLRKEFPLIDADFECEITKRLLMPLKNRFKYDYLEYKKEHMALIEVPLKDLQRKQVKTTEDKVKILIFKMLRFDKNKRITAESALKAIELINSESIEYFEV